MSFFPVVNGPDKVYQHDGFSSTILATFAAEGTDVTGISTSLNDSFLW